MNKSATPYDQFTRGVQKAPKKKAISLRLDEDTLEYFKAKGEAEGVPYQQLIQGVLNRYKSRNK